MNSIAFSPDGKILAAGTGDGQIWLWNLADPTRPARLGQPVTNSPAPGVSVISVAFSPDGRTLAAGGDDSQVWLWNLADPARPARLGQPLTGPENRAQSLAFNSGEDPGRRRRRRQGVAVEPGRSCPARPPRPAPHRTPADPGTGMNSVAFSPDGKILAARGQDYKVWLWNLADPAGPPASASPSPAPPAVPGTGMSSVGFSPDGKILAANAGDGNVWLWTLADPAHPAPLGQPLTGPASIIGSIAFSLDGKNLAAGTGDGTTQMWDLNVDDAVQRICATTGNTLTPMKWEQYLPALPYSPPCAHPGHYGRLGH